MAPDPVPANAVIAALAQRRWPLLMGIVNVTPDSFHDGSRFASPGDAAEHARRLIDEGADIIDLGGESTRPGAQPVAADEELRRVMPVLEALCGAGVPLSVDTRQPAVMRAALAAGATMINDVSALRAPGALEAVAGTDASVCLMHMQGEPRTMQEAPRYADVVGEVTAFLEARIGACLAAGISRQRIVVDPGFGFGKRFEDNLALAGALPSLAKLAPVLVGLSRKSMIGAMTGRAAADRLAGSVSAALWAARRGAAILRVHDVAATRDALAVWRQLEGEGR
ncbi:MAG: dihydropteroate synthase [Burkholderiales bacterium]|jgi:dihydropteroate synthase|nr:MAG: dihydropteroate synthase [Burkholderiales bacterium]